jgi:hypothetical protein
LSQEVKIGLRGRLYNTMVEVNKPGEYYPVIFLHKKVYDIKNLECEIRYLASKINYLYSINKIWQGFMVRCMLAKEKDLENYTLCSYPLFNGKLEEWNELKKIL